MRAPCVVKRGLISRLLETAGQFAVTDLVHMCGSVCSRYAVTGETMPRKHDGVMIVSEHVFNYFPKRAARDLHRLRGERVQALALISASRRATRKRRRSAETQSGSSVRAGRDWPVMPVIRPSASPLRRCPDGVGETAESLLAHRKPRHRFTSG